MVIRVGGGLLRRQRASCWRRTLLEMCMGIGRCCGERGRGLVWSRFSI